MSTNISKLLTVSIAALLVVIVSIEPAIAQRRGGGFRGGGGGGFRGGGGGGGFARASARPSITRPSGGGFRPGAGRVGTAGGDLANRGNINRPINGGNINRPINGGNVNRPINGGNRNNIINGGDNINVGGDWDDHYHGCCYSGWGAFAAGAAAGAITSAAIGSTVYALPSGCVTTVVNGVTYQQCGSTWYQPYFDGTSTSYVVVSAP